jgi:hypothetical protein
MVAVAAMHEEVDDWARREQQVRKDAEQVRPMLLPQEERRHQNLRESNGTLRAKPCTSLQGTFLRNLRGSKEPAWPRHPVAAGIPAIGVEIPAGCYLVSSELPGLGREIGPGGHLAQISRGG